MTGCDPLCDLYFEVEGEECPFPAVLIFSERVESFAGSKRFMGSRQLGVVSNEAKVEIVA